MATRTIPSSFPAIRERDYFAHKIDRAKLIRDLAQAQNYLWAKAYRLYSTMAYEGNGNKQTLNISDPAEEVAPDGTGVSICIASFAVPPNWGPSPRLKVQGRSVLANATGLSRGAIIIGLYELDGTYLGVVKNTAYTTNGNNDWSLEIQAPQDRTTQLRVFMASTLNGGEGGGAVHQVLNLSARYQLPNTAEMFGDDALIGWTGRAHAAADDLPLSAMMLKLLAQSTRSLFAMRPPEVCQSYLANNYGNGAGFAEVGRYTVYIPPLVTQVAGKLVVWCSVGGAGNEVRVLLGGVVQQTFTALAAGETELTVAAFNVVANAENVISVEARSTAGGADWGTIVHGRYFWEDAVNLALPGGTTVPLVYAPLDEAELIADKAIVSDLSGTARAGLKKLQENNTYLARHRLRWLVGDWCHRALKRIDTDTFNFTGTNAYPGWDWTRGPESVNHQLYHPRNISVIGDGTSSTNDAGGTPASDSKDGIGRWPNGYNANQAVSTSSWPPAQQYLRHGRRVGRWRMDSGTGTTAIINESGARLRWFARGRRLPPSFVGAYDNGQDGPAIEEPAFTNQGFFAARLVGVSSMVLSVIGTATAPTRDIDPRWYGPTSQSVSLTGVLFDIVGRCPKKLVPPITNKLEGMLFEMEMQSCLLLDDPLQQGDIDALT